MQTALTQLIEQLRISGNIHGAMEAEKFLPVEKIQLKDAHLTGQLFPVKRTSEEFFNNRYNNQ